MKKSLAAIASAFLVTCAPAFAQTAATPDAAKADAVRQMLVAMHARETVEATVRKVEDDLPSRWRHSTAARINADPKLDDKQKSDAIVKLDDGMRESRLQMHALLDDPALIDQMVDEMVPAYASTYTLDEIHQLTAFYNSPLGQKMVAKSPELVERSMQAANKVMWPRITQTMAQFPRAAPTAAAAGQ